jgi:hypothetical protein
MWGDKNWEGWVQHPLVREADGWYSFVMPTTNITDSYNMLVFSNGLPDNNPNAIQWVWNINNGNPAGRFFAADNSNPINPPESGFRGTQRNAASFSTREAANASSGNTAPSGTPAANTVTGEVYPGTNIRTYTDVTGVPLNSMGSTNASQYVYRLITESDITKYEEYLLSAGFSFISTAGTITTYRRGDDRIMIGRGTVSVSVFVN